MDPRENIVALLRQGQFSEASDLIRTLPVEMRRQPDLSVIEAEVLIETGDLTKGLQLATQVFETVPEGELRALTLRMMGQVAFYRGDADGSRASLRQARDLALTFRKTNADLFASILLVRWRLFSRMANFGIADADFDELRRAVIRSGSPHHMVELRVCVAEVEARKSSPHEALRHLSHARNLLKSYPNVWLEGMINNHTSNVFAILGDLDNAIEFGLRAVSCTDVSGHFRIRMAAHINLAELHITRGDYDSAQRLLASVLAQTGSHPHLEAAALDALAKLQLAKGEIQLAKEAFGRILALRRRKLRGITTQWDGLSELFSRARILEADNRRERARHLLAIGITRAVALHDRVWETRMRLRLASLSAQSGNSEGATTQILPLLIKGVEGPETVAELALARAETEAVLGDLHGAELHRNRGRRISAGLGRVVNADDQSVGSPLSATAEHGVNLSAALDDAVALIELAGYPHVLAREAYALLELTGAADAMALVARRDQRVRCVAAHGWTPEQAEAIAADPGERLRMPCGTHRDELWEIVAELKPALNDRCTGVAIRKLVDTAVTLDRYRREEKQRAALWPADTLETDGGLWVSEQMTELLSIARRIAPADISVLLTGETGTGKEVLARAIHRASPRAARPFVAFNCTAVPREMLESQLFGYRKGAFTGAEAAFDGVIRAAAGGTLFLDEIAEIGLDLQPKLLRFLETHEVHGLGESQPVKVDVRVIAATNADLESLVAEGRFREDLFYRLNVVRLRLPPLRERREEIPPLIDHYLHRFAEEQKKGRLTLDDETLEYLVLYPWPGNVRQLVNEMSRVVAYADPDGTVTPALLSPEIQASRRTVKVQPGDEPEIRVRLDQPLNDAVEAIERMMVVRALDRARGNYENAARLLGISRKGLFLKRRRWGMQRAS